MVVDHLAWRLNLNDLEDHRYAHLSLRPRVQLGKVSLFSYQLFSHKNDLATMTIRGLLFDKDGTLLDYHETWMDVNWSLARRITGVDDEAALRLMVKGGYEPELDRVRSGTPLAVGTAREIAVCFSPELEGSALENLAADFDRIFTEGARMAAVPVEGLKETLEGLKVAGYHLGIATTDSRAGIDATLGQFEVLDLFEFLAGCDSGHGVKPEPGMVQAFCAAMGLEASEVAVIGDNAHDMAMGSAAGAALLVGVLTGTSNDSDLRPHAHYVLQSIADLPALLLEL